MRKASVEELRGRISAGEYPVDSRKVAADILSKFALIGRVRRLLISEDEEGTADDAGRGTQARGRRRSRPGPSESLRRATNAFRKDSPR
jgi:hypothetical protein